MPIEPVPTNSAPTPDFPVTQPPLFCEYATGACDQSFEFVSRSHGLFLFPSDPPIIANTIESAVQELCRVAGYKRWTSWKHLGITGQIIFCEICKALRFTELVVADVTTLNFNLLFEIGYALGLGLPVVPIRDTSIIRDKKIFDELGLLDTLGYLDFQNSSDLVGALLARSDIATSAFQKPQIDKEQPLYLMKSNVQTDGMVKLISALKKSGLRFRSFDPRETTRLSLHEAFKQAMSSLGVVVNLVAPYREGAQAHNGRCAFVAGIAMAAGRRVLMLQEAQIQQPIDFRDVIKSYSDATKVSDLVLPLIRGVVETLQESRFVPVALPLKPLEKVDLGDLAAENEIKALRAYFVATGEYNEVKRGHARLVVGRKGAGKTAIFYGVRSAYKPSKSHLVLDLKPEGHQFTKLREAVLKELSPGLQQHVLTAFWNYLLLMEIAHKIIHEEFAFSFHSTMLRESYLRVVKAYGADRDAEQGDFSERLLKLVDSIVNRRKAVAKIAGTSEVTQLVYGEDIRPLNDALSEFLALSRKEDVWLLFDNLDKGWPVRAATEEDILLLKCLLEATRKLERQFESRDINFHGVVFIRNDIYQHLVLDPADRGKDTPVQLDWNDPEVFKEILRRRMMQSTGLDGTFDVIWPIFFETHIKGEESFSYILGRTLMRPRDVLRFIRGCIEVAVNRGHDRVTEADIEQAEHAYSEDAFVDITHELKDVNPRYSDVPYSFVGAPETLSRRDIEGRVREAGVPADEFDAVIDLLLWFGFLGVYASADEERYSYQFQYDLKKLHSGLRQHAYSIHPSFRSALGCVGRS
jgi:hypothetical protein